MVAMKNILNKDIIRDIKKSKGRFISILSIVVLGVAFFAGIKVSPIVMKKTADIYYDDYNFMDINLISTIGITDNDVKEISKINGVDGIFPTYSMDVISKIDSSEKVIKIHGLPASNLNNENKDYINRVNVIEGSLPKKLGECVLEKSKVDKINVPIGETIKIKSGDSENLGDKLKNTEYKVVGYVETPYYLSYEKGNSNIGDGSVSGVMMVLEPEFKSDIYNELFLTVDNAKDEDSYSEKYFSKVDDVVKDIDAISQKQIESRYKDIKSGENLKTQQKVENPKWHILDRNSNYSYVEYESCADSIDALAKIFPVFFFLVASLVCLTTMTRMVDEQRINIGTLKALGYSTRKIAKKYILYAFSASFIGSIIGIVIGFTLFPTVIFTSYGLMYSLPKMKFVFDLYLAIGVSFIAIFITTMSAYLACKKELKETPSILMRPKSPKDGKRILIERFPFVWDKIGFIGKVTIRNIFRYKKRFFMTVLGISGCTALILAGLGIKDSIRMVANGQYGEILKYDMILNIDNNATNNKLESIKKYISNDKKIRQNIFIENKAVKINKDKKEKQVNIIIPYDKNDMEKFIGLKNPETESLIKLDDNGVVISEKVAKDLDIKVGNYIDITDDNDKKRQVKVVGITENYLSHYIYMSKDYYKDVFKDEPSYNRMLAKLENSSDNYEKELSKQIIQKDGITGVSFNTGVKDNFEKTIKSLDYVVLIMTLSAGALAFVVLYNLTNVNISERIREIATIKVLGFYDNEVSSYIYRENIILTFIGTIVGLFAGKLLHRFIMVTVELENMTFGKVLDFKSYIIAFILTMILGFIVNISMNYKLKNVKMVESLKSVD